MEDSAELIGRPIETLLPALKLSKSQHSSDLELLQRGEGAFVWARHRDSGELWFLDEDTGKINRPFVRENLVCPVPGCAEKLTSAHRSTKRDGLQHFAGRGGHSLESIFHSQGCALIESWLSRTYPQHHVQREEYTNEKGERRADVLIRNDAGIRVAFEVQYSPLTPDAWLARHESYRNQEIVDVWLFGHTKGQLNVDLHTGKLKPNRTHEAVIATKSPLFFINPEYEIVGFAVNDDYEHEYECDDHIDRQASHPVLVLDRPRGAGIQVRPLSRFRVSRLEGFSSDLLKILHNSTTELRRLNAKQQILATQLRLQTERYERLAHEADQREVAERHQERAKNRQPQIVAIRELLDGSGSWVQNGVFQAIWEYLDGDTTDRILVNTESRLEGVLTRWQCVIYFDLIAGKRQPFGTRDAFNAIVARGVRMGQSDAFKMVARYLYRLEEGSILERNEIGQKYPKFTPTVKGAWY